MVARADATTVRADRCSLPRLFARWSSDRRGDSLRHRGVRPVGRYIDAHTGQRTGTFDLKGDDFDFMDAVSPHSPFIATRPEINTAPPLAPQGFVARSADGRRIKIRDDYRREVVYWSGRSNRSLLTVNDTATGRMLWSAPLSRPVQSNGNWHLHGLQVADCQFSLDGQRLAIVTRAWTISNMQKDDDTAPVDVPEGITIYETETGRVVGRLSEGYEFAFADDGTAVFALQAKSDRDVLVRCDPQTGECRTVAEYRGRIRDVDEDAAMFVPDWLLRPTRLADGRIVAARVMLTFRWTRWSLWARNVLNRLSNQASPVRLPTQLIDFTTGRELGNGQFGTIRLAVASDGNTLAGNSIVMRGAQRQSCIEVWDLPPRRSWPRVMAGMAFWTAALAMVFGVVKLLRWLLK